MFVSKAARLFGAAEALREVIEQQMTSYERLEYDQEVAALREQMNADALASAWDEGRAMSMERAVAYATSTDGAATESRQPSQIRWKNWLVYESQQVTAPAVRLNGRMRMAAQ